MIHPDVAQILGHIHDAGNHLGNLAPPGDGRQASRFDGCVTCATLREELACSIKCWIQELCSFTWTRFESTSWEAESVNPFVRNTYADAYRRAENWFAALAGAPVQFGVRPGPNEFETCQFGA
jgi:hypothetical protein